MLSKFKLVKSLIFSKILRMKKKNAFCEACSSVKLSFMSQNKINIHYLHYIGQKKKIFDGSFVVHQL